MRDLKTLWELVLEEVEFDNSSLRYGICFQILALEISGEISCLEFDALESCLKDNNPTDKKYGYYWPMGDDESRIDFINERIKQHSK